MGRKSELRAMRKKARDATEGLDYYSERFVNARTKTLGECTKGAYKALKRGRVNVRTV